MNTGVRKSLTSNFFSERCGDTERTSISHPTPAGQDTLRHTPYSIRNTMVDYLSPSQHAPVRYASVQYRSRRQSQRLATNDNLKLHRNRTIPLRKSVQTTLRIYTPHTHQLQPHHTSHQNNIHPPTYTVKTQDNAKQHLYR